MTNNRATSIPSPVSVARTKHVIRVEHRHQRWEVAHNGLCRPMIDASCSRERAVDHALEMTESLLLDGQHVVLVFEGGDFPTRNDARRTH